MIEAIKNKIWNVLKEKEISLAVIYDREGKILWHKGRAINGKDVFKGSGFCKSYIEESLRNPGKIDIEDYIRSNPQELSRSAEVLLVKSIIIHPIGRRLFLYVDSGKKEFFTEKDRYSFSLPGELLNILKRAGIMLDSPITGDKISSLLNVDESKSPFGVQGNGKGKLEEIREKVEAGENFWEVIWKPFIDREMDRNTVKSILESFYRESSHSFKKMIRYLNVEDSDYKKFMSLLYKYRIDPRT